MGTVERVEGSEVDDDNGLVLDGLHSKLSAATGMDSTLPLDVMGTTELVCCST